MRNILHTKLHRPLITAEHVYRSSLIDFLNKNKYKPLSLISAPAGYGKSMLVSSWLEKCSCQYAWISLSSEDSDLATFLSYLQYTIEHIFPKSLEQFSLILKGSKPPPLDIIIELLLNDLDKINDEFIIVLDDFHLIQNKQIDELINLLVSYPPQNMHLVIISRQDPNLNIGSLRAYSRINEIRTKELRFKRKEISELIEKLLHIEIKEEVLEHLFQKTEGWVTGLLLTSLVLRDLKDQNHIIENIGTNTNQLVDYLVKEVLIIQPPKMQNILLKSSILNRFSAELINQLISNSTSNNELEITGTAFIDWILKSNLFIISLDNENQWFRLHHLFQDLLQKYLYEKHSKEAIDKLHLQTSIWFENNEFYEEALEHSLKTGDSDLPVKIFERHRTQMMNTEQWSRLNNWIKLIPEDIVFNNPIILLTKAFLYDYRGETHESIELLDQIEPLLESLAPGSDTFQQAKGEYYSLLSEKYFLEGNKEMSIKSAIKATRFFKYYSGYAYSFALYWHSFSLFGDGNFEQAQQLLLESIENRERFDVYTRLRFHLPLCGIYFMNGDFDKLEAIAKRTLRLSKQINLQESIDLSNYFLGSLYFNQNELKKALKHFTALYENRYDNRLVYAVLGGCMNSFMYFAKGDYKKSRMTSSSLTDFMSNSKIELINEYKRAFQVEMALRKNESNKAIELDKGVDYKVYSPFWFVFVPQLTSIKVLMKLSSTRSRGLVEQKLSDLLVFAIESHNVNLEIYSLVLKGLYLWNINKKDEAITIVSESIKLAAFGRFIRVYVECGETMKNIIDHLPSYHAHKSFIHQIKLAFIQELKHVSQVNTTTSNLSKVYSRENLTELLSFRELEVLKLLALGLRNKEIASKLFITIDTVKKHLKSIYSKFDVHTRMHAVRRATHLGVLKLSKKH